jgi:cobalt-zinc-cadmium efflux system protein
MKSEAAMSSREPESLSAEGNVPVLEACAHVSPGALADPVTMRRLRFVFVLTSTFMVVEAVGGWLSGSLALLADAGHMLVDTGALGLTLLTARIARRPADANKTYGYHRWEILAAFINGTVLVGIAVWVVIEAIGRIQDPPSIRAGLFLAVAAVGLLINLWALALLHSRRHGSLNTRGAYLHIVGDALGSVGALSAAVVILLTGWTLADPLISIALSLLILVGAWRLVSESVEVLLEAVPRHLSMAEVQRRMLAVEGVRTVHDLHVWTVTSGMVAMSGHVIVPALETHPDVLDRVRSEMSAMGIAHVTIQLEVDPCLEGPPPAHAKPV